MVDFNLYKNRQHRPLIMGILNLTPDSFSDGGKYNNLDNAIAHALSMEKQGADIIDIGAQSTRPGCTKISIEEEDKRLFPIFNEIRKNIHIPLSVDTFYTEIAKKALINGADVINDVSGRQDNTMIKLVKQFNASIIIMDTSKNISEIQSFFKTKLNQIQALQLSTDNVCFDPGIGFNKSQLENAKIIANISALKVDNISLLIGLSKKSVLSYLCKDETCNRLTATVVADMFAMINGADILRVHDVKEHIDAIKLIKHLLNLRKGE